MLLTLILTTALLARFGAEDFAHALTFPGRITGAVLLAVAFTTLLGAAGVLDHWIRHSFSHSGLVALIGAFAALLTNVLVLVETVKDGDSKWYPTLFAALSAGSAWAVLTVWRTVLIPAPKRVAAAVVVSSVIAVANFSYQNLYVPYQRKTEPLITLSVGKEVRSKDGKAFSVPVDITIQNHGSVGFYVLGTEFHAMGLRVPLSPKDRLRKQWQDDTEQWSKSSVVNPLSRREVYQPGELVAAKPWMPIGQWIESSGTFATRLVVQLPMNTPYDQVAFYATASLARKDRLVLQPPLRFVGNSWGGGKISGQVKQDQQRGVDSLIYRARVRENNALDAYTRDARFVTVYWKFGPQGVNVLAAVARKGEEGRVLTSAEQREMVSRYGLVDLFAGPHVRTLWDIKSKR
ncbi:hypothetical protein ACWGPD_09185 [Streptomyces hirsutus]|uniref:hypothetical protein n=1 Tax=Streptomyces hirsutus TaxID=35620 RepID=UPI003316D3D3